MSQVTPKSIKSPSTLFCDATCVNSIILLRHFGKANCVLCLLIIRYSCIKSRGNYVSLGLVTIPKIPVNQPYLSLKYRLLFLSSKYRKITLSRSFEVNTYFFNKKLASLGNYYSSIYVSAAFHRLLSIFWDDDAFISSWNCLHNTKNAFISPIDSEHAGRGR